MTNIPRALAVSLLSSAFLLTDTAAFAQSNTATPPTTATRPTAPDQNSLPNADAPPASPTQTTGSTSDPKLREMNQAEKDKVDRQGK